MSAKFSHCSRHTMSVVFALVMMLLFERASLGCTIYKGHVDGLTDYEDGYDEEESAHGRFR